LSLLKERLGFEKESSLWAGLEAIVMLEGKQVKNSLYLLSF
jgi:hypothetical protein